jgi:phosphoribosylformylglycinamidine synthase
VIFYVQLKTGLLGGSKSLDQVGAEAIASILHDRMTEMVIRDPQEAIGLFQTLEAPPLAFIDISAGLGALVKANVELGLAM